MKDNLAVAMDSFNLWLFTSNVKTVKEVKEKWVSVKENYFKATIKEFEESLKEKK